jgi:hypothetical protein
VRRTVSRLIDATISSSTILRAKKAGEYLQAGVLVVILIEQDERRAELHRGEATIE